MPESDAAERFYTRSRDRLARNEPDLAAVRHDLLHNPGHRYAAARDFLQQQPGGAALELGYGGHGLIEGLAPLAQTYDVVDVVARVDPALLPGNVRMTNANLDDPFPFADASFDIVIAMMVIEHLYDPFHAFAEVARVTRPGGQVFVNLPNIASLKCRLQLLAGKMPVTSSPDWFENREWDGSHLHYFTVADVRRLAALNRLAIRQIHPVGRMLPLKRLRPSLFCHEITYVLEKLAA